MKKILNLFLSALIFSTSLITLISCSNEDENESSPTEIVAEEGSYLALNAYEITLNVGETFTLDAKLYDGSDERQTAQETTYTVDVEQIASVKDGVITAKQAGTTYINVYADGVAASCFVTVVNKNVIDGLIIRFNTQKLYQGVSQQASALLYDNGTLIAEPTVEWSVADAETLEITANGMVTPKKLAESATITATCEYEGKTYTAEKQIAVVAPTYYALSASNVKLASPLTLSGVENASYITKDIALTRVNVLTGEVEQVSAADYTITISDAEVATLTVTETGVQLLQAKNVGKTTFAATLVENGENVGGKLEVAHTIASVADMDVLSLASWNDSSLLSESFLMVNDIDYQGDVMMPIAEYDDSKGTRSLGVQWKYRLKTAGKNGELYEYVNRAAFGKKATACLSDGQFSTLNSVGGLNKNNAASFSGTFDGNGYSIKNGELFYGPAMVIPKGADGTYCSAYSHLFGQFTGTLKNVSFENIGMQNPKDVTIEGVEYGIDAVYLNDAIEPEKLQKTESGDYYHLGASIIAYANACVIENVYVEMRETEVSFVPGQGFGALICWGYDPYVANCVADIQMLKEGNSVVYTIVGKGDKTGTFENILAINNNSASAFYQATGEKNYGFNGNYWNTTTDWKTLFTLTAGTVETVQSIEQTVSSYDSNIWDMSNFGADKDGRPVLKKGCSV